MHVYWFDYNGNDTNNGGIGDTPYNIPDPTGSKDLYPLMRPCCWEKIWNINWGNRDDPHVETPNPYLHLSG